MKQRNLIKKLEEAGFVFERHGGNHDINKQDIPKPSDQFGALEKVKQDTEIIDFSKGILTYVDVDFSEYRRKTDMKTVRRNVALPSWLNYEAEHAGVNVSRILQEALINTLNLKGKI